MFDYCHDSCTNKFRSACYTEANARYEEFASAANAFWEKVFETLPEGTEKITIKISKETYENNGFVTCYELVVCADGTEICGEIVKIGNDCCIYYQVMAFQKRSLELLKKAGFEVMEESEIPICTCGKKEFTIHKIHKTAE